MNCVTYRELIGVFHDHSIDVSNIGTAVTAYILEDLCFEAIRPNDSEKLITLPEQAGHVVHAHSLFQLPGRGGISSNRSL